MNRNDAVRVFVFGNQKSFAKVLNLGMTHQKQIIKS